jgi:hypothetical protein
MIKDAKYLADWEKKRMASEPPDYMEAVKLIRAMIEEARAMGVWPPKDPLEGIEVDIKIAKVVNAIKPD